MPGEVGRFLDLSIEMDSDTLEAAYAGMTENWNGDERDASVVPDPRHDNLLVPAGGVM